MSTYIIRRFVQGLVVLLFSTCLIYTVLFITPGGPVDQYWEAMATGGSEHHPNIAALVEVMKQYKLDSPYPLSYLRWLFDPSDTQHLNPTTTPIISGKV